MPELAAYSLLGSQKIGSPNNWFLKTWFKKINARLKVASPDKLVV